MASSSEVRFALMGMGRISKRHADLLSQKQIAGARLVALCESDPLRRDKAKAQYQLPVYAEINELLDREDVDVVSILTPSGLHPQHALQVARRKKHVLVEKPMGLRLEDADHMIRECREQGVELFVVKQNRFNVPVVKLRQALEAGRFGKITMGTIRVRWCRDMSYYNQDAWRGTWELDGGSLTNQSSHHVDLLQWMMGEVESVTAQTRTFLVPKETEDTTVAMLKFKSGALGMIEATTAVRPKDLEGSISILGEKGTVEIGGFAVNQIRHWNFVESTSEDQDVISKFSVNPPNVYGYGHQAYLEHVVACLNGGAKNLVPGEEGRRSLELIHAIYCSAENGGKEVFMKDRPQSRRLGRKNDR